jgi:hypothetical protein
MESNEDKLKSFVHFQIQRNVITLYKKYINLLEDMQEDHINMLNKLNSKVDLETLKNVDYFDENKYNYIRKKILDSGNEAIREIERNLEKLNFTLK